MQRLSSWMIGLLALAVFVAAGYVITKKDPVPDAGKVLPVISISGDPSAKPGAASAGGGGPGDQVVAFLGDDWTAGIGASSKSKRFTSLLAAQLGASEKNFGADGSGYAKSGSGDGGAYDDRVNDVVAAKPDVIVVAGGRNDVGDALPALRKRIKALFADLHERLPKATLIAVAPMWGDSDAPGELAPVGSAVHEYVDDAGGSYLNISDPIHGHPEYMNDSADPNDKGYAAIAKALAPKIRRLLS